MGMLVIAAVLILPGPLLTVWNVWTLIFKKKHSGKVEAAAFALGIVYMALLYGLWQPRPWEESIVKPSDMSSLHEPLSREYILTVLVLFVVGIVSYAFLKMREEKAAPLAKVLAMAGVYLGIAVNLLFIIQLLGITADNEIFMNALPFDVLLMMLVPFNYIILAVNQLLQPDSGKELQLGALCAAFDPAASLRHCRDSSSVRPAAGQCHPCFYGDQRLDSVYEDFSA